MISVWCRVVQCGAAVWWAGVLIITYHQLHHPTLLLLSGDTTLPHWDWGEGIQYSVLRVECSEEARKFPVWLLQVRAGQASKEWLGLTEPGCVIIMTNINSPALDITPPPLSLPSVSGCGDWLRSLKVWRCCSTAVCLTAAACGGAPEHWALVCPPSPLSADWLCWALRCTTDVTLTDCVHTAPLSTPHMSLRHSVLITAVNSIAI